MNIAQYFTESPYLATISLLFTVGSAAEVIFRSWNRLLRSWNIRKHGWPPPHCDADGDFRPTEEPKP